MKTPSQADITSILHFLSDGHWHCAASCSVVLQCDERHIRAVAHASDGRIGSGQQGYKLVTAMTEDEYQHYISWMRSQSSHMLQRITASECVRSSSRASASTREPASAI